MSGTVNMDVSYLKNKTGIMSWLYTLDHKRIGVMYLISVAIAFALGGIFALALRMELLSPQQIFFTAKQYNQIFTLHGAAMVFLFIIPSIPAALGNFILPLKAPMRDVQDQYNFNLGTSLHPPFLYKYYVFINFNSFF